MKKQKNENVSYLSEVLDKLKEHKMAMAGLVVLIVEILMVVFLPMILKLDPYTSDYTAFSAAPGGAHILGTDAIGRDVFARLMYGGRTSLLVGFVSTLISCAIGVPLGLVAGYARGKAEAVIMRIADMMLAFPGLVLALAVAGIMGASIRNAIIAIVAVNWTKYARLARSLVMKIRDRDYVAAAVVTGSKTPYMLLRYMLPNALPTLIITAATDVGGMMLEIAALSFLGFGAKPPTPEWGYMLNEGRACMQSAPWMMLYPGLAIFLVVVVFNMLGDSIRDILDPRDE